MKAARKKPVISGRGRSRTALPADRPQQKIRSSAFAPRGTNGAHWTFLTNHTHVLVLLSQNPFLVLREVAQQVGITERAVQRIIADLETAGIIERERIGRRNHYRIRNKRPLRHAVTSHCTIGALLALLKDR